MHSCIRGHDWQDLRLTPTSAGEAIKFAEPAITDVQVYSLSDLQDLCTELMHFRAVGNPATAMTDYINTLVIDPDFNKQDFFKMLHGTYGFGGD